MERVGALARCVAVSVYLEEGLEEGDTLSWRVLVHGQERQVGGHHGADGQCREGSTQWVPARVPQPR